MLTRITVTNIPRTQSHVIQEALLAANLAQNCTIERYTPGGSHDRLVGDWCSHNDAEEILNQLATLRNKFDNGIRWAAELPTGRERMDMALQPVKHPEGMRW